MFLLMAAALVESYRAQSVMSSPPAALALYDREDQALQTVLHGFNQSQSLARDLLLKPGTSQTIPPKLQKCEQEVRAGLGQLEQIELASKAGPELERDSRSTSGFFTKPPPGRRANWRGGARNCIGNNCPLSAQSGQQTAAGYLGSEISPEEKLSSSSALSAGEASARHILFLLGADLLLALGVAGSESGLRPRVGHANRCRKVEEIAHAKREMQQLSGRLLTIQEEERHRLSRDLHDGIGQLLTALRLEISHLGLDRQAI